MSCRSTAHGSLATTYAQHISGLTDAQSTSVYHALMREAADGVSAPTDDDFHRTLSTMLGRIQHAHASGLSTTLVNRLRARATRALVEGCPDDPARAHAFIRMPAAAESAREAIDQWLRFTAVRAGRDVEDVRQEFTRVARDRTLTGNPPLPDTIPPALQSALPGDSGTRRALAHIERSIGRSAAVQRRCPTCQQFLPADGSHLCTDATPTPTPTAPLTQTGWATDMDAFQSAYDKAKERIGTGATRVPTFTHLEEVPGGVTGGLAAPGGMTFGVELEVDFPDEDPDDLGSTRQALAQRLYEEGLTSEPYVARWHYIGGEGENRPGGTYEVRPDGWVCEFDRSVDDVDGERGVEIKSQILHDEPQTWQNLRRICEIVEELGGRATPRCGLHVNVSGAGFPTNDPRPHASLLRLAAAYDDTLVRMAHNPESAAQHRGRRHCAPNHVPVHGFRDVSEARQFADHYNAINLGHMPDEYNAPSSSSRVEVRIFDSTLDPGRIQAQVALSVALVAAGRRGEPVTLAAEPAGTHRRTYGSSRLEGEAWEASTASFRGLVDLVAAQGLSTDEHRQQLTHLFAASRWQQA